MEYFTYNSDIKKFEPTASTGTTLEGKAPIDSPTFTGTVVLPTTTSIGAVNSTEIGYVDGVTAPIQTQINTNTPIGMLAPFAGSASPAGWLLCAGQTVPRLGTYANLFDVISTTYNTGGEAGTDFRLPDLRGRVIAGVDNMNGTDAGRLDLANTLGTSAGTQNTTLTAAQMPVHSHSNTAAFTGTSVDTGFDNADHAHTFSFTETVDSTGDGAARYDSSSAGSQGTQSYATGGRTGGAYGDGTHKHAITASGTVAMTNADAGGSGSPATTQPHSNLQPTLLLNYIIKY
jgi:microcystin-dependent protein